MWRPFLVCLALATTTPADGSGRPEGDMGSRSQSASATGQTWLDPLLRVSGTFAVIHFERDGQVQDAQALKAMKVIQHRSEWTFTMAGFTTEGRDALPDGPNSQAIDSTYTNGGLKGTKVLGIYKVMGNKVIYCQAAAGQPRPTAFATTPGSGLTLFCLQRIPARENNP
jgi:uncharacterized protein (TIGR03067 family)